jgi:hypothetical protein
LERVPKVGSERASLVIGQIERHNAVNMGASGRILVSDLDIWRAANLLIRKHEPEIEAIA